MALSVPLSRSTLRVGGGSAFFVRLLDHHEIYDNTNRNRKPERYSREQVTHRCVRLGSLWLFGCWRGWHHQSIEHGQTIRCCDLPACFRGCIQRGFLRSFAEALSVLNKPQPNQSPEPTAVGAVRSAVAVHAASRRWLSFFR